MRVVVAQRGAREHYLAARALHREGALCRLVVDWYAGATRTTGWLSRRLGDGALARGLANRCEELPASLVIALNGQAIRSKACDMLAGWRGRRHAGFIRSDSAFARAVARLRLPEHDAFFGYSYASLEALRAEGERGRLTVVDQIDPARAEYRRVEEERRAWPSYALPRAPVPQAYFDRCMREWEQADVIVVNSEWTRELLQEENAPSEKIEVVPLAYEPGDGAAPRKGEVGDPLRVLWVGTVSLRKGIQYLAEAARMLAGEPVAIRVVGALDIQRSAVAEWPSNMTWDGPVARSRIGDVYGAADVFVLPTVSDGFAITQLEAMAYGLPLVVTPNCARVVEDGVTGFVAPARNPEALAEALRRFVRSPESAIKMGERCRAEAERYSVSRYAAALSAILQKRSCGEGSRSPEVRSQAGEGGE